MRVVASIVAALAVMLALGGCAAQAVAGSGTPSTNDSCIGSGCTLTIDTRTPTYVPEPLAPVETTAPSVPEPPAAPAGPLTTFGVGTYEVGTGPGQVAPGKYRSPGPDESGSDCYYVRLKHNDGSSDDIIHNDLSKGQTFMTVQKSDGYVTVDGCTFTKV